MAKKLTSYDEWANNTSGVVSEFQTLCLEISEMSRGFPANQPGKNGNLIFALGIVADSLVTRAGHILTKAERSIADIAPDNNELLIAVASEIRQSARSERLIEPLLLKKAVDKAKTDPGPVIDPDISILANRLADRADALAVKLENFPIPSASAAKAAVGAHSNGRTAVSTKEDRGQMVQKKLAAEKNEDSLRSILRRNLRLSEQLAELQLQKSFVGPGVGPYISALNVLGEMIRECAGGLLRNGINIKEFQRRTEDEISKMLNDAEEAVGSWKAKNPDKQTAITLFDRALKELSGLVEEMKSFPVLDLAKSRASSENPARSHLEEQTQRRGELTGRGK